MRYMMFDDLYTSMPWDKIDNVVFDVGNVLLRYDPQALLNEHVPDVPELHPLLLRRVFNSPYWVMRDHGIISEEDAIQAMTGRYTEIAEPVRRIMQRWIDLKDVLPDGLAALHACKAHGKKLYVLSNYADEPFDYIEQKQELFRLFDGKIISGKVKMMKPDPAIYRTLLLTYGLDPARTLFMDDNLANVEAALTEGIQAIHVNEEGKLARFFGEAQNS